MSFGLSTTCDHGYNTVPSDGPMGDGTDPVYSV
jgi:hypothetical protein